jgi:hypothetical protein
MRNQLVVVARVGLLFAGDNDDGPVDKAMGTSLAQAEGRAPRLSKDVRGSRLAAEANVSSDQGHGDAKNEQTTGGGLRIGLARKNQ